MLTVSILINGEPLFTRSARNHARENENGETLYKTDAGDEIWHNQQMDNGAIELAKKMLDTIKAENV